MGALDELTAWAQARVRAGGARIKVRLVKGANLAMEHVEAELHDWPAAPYLSKPEVDANYVRILDRHLTPERTAAVRLGAASHNLFHVALAVLLARGRGVGEGLDVEMLQGMAPVEARLVRAEVTRGAPDEHGDVVLYTPVVRDEDFDVAISYLVRRLEENAAEQNFLHASFAPPSAVPGVAGTPMDRQEVAFRGSVTRGLDYTPDDVAPRRRSRFAAEPAPVTDGPFRNATDTDPAVATRAKHLAATLRNAAEAIVPGHVTRYDDSYNPRAFGDLVQQWGTSTVLIESGGWYDDPEKQVLRRTNFVLLTRAFDAIATGSYLDTPVERYTQLPENGRAVRDLVIRNATVVIPGLQPYRADLAVDVSDGPLARDQGSIVEIGDLGGVLARDDFDAEGLFVHMLPEALDQRDGRNALRPGAAAAFVVRAGASPDSRPVALFQGGRLIRLPQ